MKKGKSQIINFRFVKNLIIVPVNINGKGPFNFVLDTGVGVLLLTDPSLTDSLHIKNLRTIKITGFGEGKDLEADITPQLDISMNNNIKASIPSAILKKDAFDLSSYTGVPIHGLLGYEFFNSFIVKINYTLKTIKIYKPETWYIPRKGHPVHISIENGKPYINTEIRIDTADLIKAKLIIDTGAGHPVWLESYNDMPIPVPDKNIQANLGVGLSGDIDGKIARLDWLKLGKYRLNDVVAAFPEFGDVGSKVSVKRNGNIGNAILKKFDVVFDYNREHLYLRPNSTYKLPFEHDMSGIELAFTPPEYKRLYVARLEKGSPGEESGLQVNDEIISINFKTVKDMDIDDIYNLLRSKEERTLLLQVVPKGKTKIEFVVLTLKRRI